MNWNKNLEKLNQCLSQISFRNIEGYEIGADKGFLEWLQRTQKVRRSNKTIFFVGNGASASMASHMAADVSKNGLISA